MIGRWMFWPHFISACILVSWEGLGKTSCGGCLRARAFSRLSLSIEFSRPLGLFLFLGRAFGDLRLLLEWHFLLGQLLVVRFLLWTILGGVWLWWIDASYANRMGSQLIIFFFIVGWWVLCGMPFLPGLVFAGLCLAQSKSYLLAGGRIRNIVVWKMIPLCIMWCIWREQNDRCFEDSSRSSEGLLHFFLFTIFT